MAYTPYTPVGSNLSDLGRLLEAGEARSSAENLQRMSMMFQNAQKKADLESRRAENEADRKLKYFEVDQRKALQTRSLDMENERLKAEAERWFAGHGLKEREVSAYEKQSGAPDPRVARENAITRAQRQEMNTMAKRAAAEAQRQLDSITANTGGVKTEAWFGGFPFSGQGGMIVTAGEAAANKRKAGAAQDAAITAVRESLAKQFGDAASLVDLVPSGESNGLVKFKAIAREMPMEDGAPVSSPAREFFGPQLPPAANLESAITPDALPAAGQPVNSVSRLPFDADIDYHKKSALAFAARREAELIQQGLSPVEAKAVSTAEARRKYSYLFNRPPDAAYGVPTSVSY